MKKRVKFLVIVVILMLSIVIYTEPPRPVLGYTGFLVVKGSNPPQPYTGYMHMRFKLYENETASISISGAGGYLWMEEHASVQFYQDNPGEFSVELGHTAFFPSIDFTKQYWLGIEVEVTDFGNPPVAANEHRFKLYMVPYSFNSLTTSGVETYTGSDPENPRDGQIWLRTDL